MMHFIEDKQEPVKNRWYMIKFVLRIFLFNMITSGSSAYFLYLNGISHWYNWFFILPLGLYVSIKYDRIMRFINSGNTYFWLIMAFAFAGSVLFLCEIFVRFYLQVS